MKPEQITATGFECLDIHTKRGMHPFAHMCVHSYFIWLCIIHILYKMHIFYDHIQLSETALRGQLIGVSKLHRFSLEAY